MEPVILRSRAFSIVELLVVIAIISILMALTVPAVSSLIENTNVTRGAQLVESQIQLARQLASSRNRPVEVRLIKVPAQSAAGSVPFNSGRWTRRVVPMPRRPAR